MNVFDLTAKISLDSSDYDNGLKKAGDAIGKVGGKIKDGFSTIAKVGGAALTAASAGVVALTKSSVDSYGEYEQMVGGVKKLYGNMGMSLQEYADSVGKSIDDVEGDWNNLEKAQNMVLDNAKNAYKTAGMSANEYMNMATTFSAALINSLGGDTVKAAEQTDVAMKAISDNFNTFGGDIGMIQGAFQGFAKQNYTMLDNLKLGYGGTKTEMERLISDANKYAVSIGQAGNLSINSFSDIVTAIELVQEKQNIAGTTAREAATTIQGSLGMVKAAWSNLVTGMSDPDADIGVLIDNMVDSASTAAENLLPAIERGLAGVGKLIDKIAPVLTEKLPSIVESTLPSILSAATSLVTGVVAALPSIIKVLIDQIPTVMSQISQSITDNSSQILSSLRQVGSLILESLTSGLNKIADDLENIDFEKIASTIGEKLSGLFDSETGAFAKIGSAASRIIQNFMNGLTDAIPKLVPAVNEIIESLGEFIINDAPAMIESGVNLIASLATGISETLPTLIPVAIDVILELAESLIDNVDKLVDASEAVIDGIIDGLVDSLPILIEKAPIILFKLAEALVKHLPDIMFVGPKVIYKLIEGIGNALPKLEESMKTAVATMAQYIQENYGEMIEKGKEIITNLIAGIKENFAAMKTSGSELIENIKAGISEKISAISDGFSAVFQAMLNNPFVSNVVDYVVKSFDNLKTTLSGIWDGIKQYAEGAWEMIKNVILGPVILLIDVVTGDFSKIETDAAKIWENIKNAASNMWNGIAGVITSAVDGIWTNVKNIFELLKNHIINIWNLVKDTTVSAWTNIKDKVVTAVTNLFNSVKQKLTELPGVLREKVDQAVQFLKDLPGKALEWGKDMIGGFIRGIQEKWNDLKDSLAHTADTIRDFLGFSEPKEGPLSNFHTFAPDMMKLFAEGIKQNTDLITNQIEKSFDFSNFIPDLQTPETQRAEAIQTTGGNVTGDVTININGYNQDPKELAETIANIINHDSKRMQVAYA